jgi:hypothetical protein
VDAWRGETAADLAEAKRLIAPLLGSVSGELDSAQVRSVWLAYIRVEKSVAFIRLETDEENPGRFIKMKPYEVPDERQALGFALRYLNKGEEEFRLGDFKESLKALRESRNYLRVMLRRDKLRKRRETRRG